MLYLSKKFQSKEKNFTYILRLITQFLLNSIEVLRICFKFKVNFLDMAYETNY